MTNILRGIYKFSSLKVFFTTILLSFALGNVLALDSNTTEGIDKEAYLDLSQEYTLNQVVIEQANSFTSFFKDIYVGFLSALVGTKSSNVDQLPNKISNNLANTVIGKTESFINKQTSTVANSFGSGKTFVTLQNIESEKPSYSVDTIQPLSSLDSNSKSLTFMQGSVSSGFNEGERRHTLNVGLGQRYLLDDKQAIAGINLFVDLEGSSKHKRASIGAEYQRANFGITTNSYHPISDKKVVGDYTEEALTGYDINLSGQVPYVPWATIKGTHYYWNQKVGDNINSNTLSVEIKLSPSIDVEFGQQDSNLSEQSSFVKLTSKLPVGSNEKFIQLVFDDKPFRGSTVMDLTSLKPAKRSSQIKIEKINIAPVFTSSATASVAENQTSAITLVATDATTITYSISGTDSSLFAVNSSTGVVTFVTAPDYESPSDADTNNTYLFTATATDTASIATTQSVTITVTDLSEEGITQSKTAMTVGEAGTNTYTVVLDSEPSASVTITPSSRNTSAATVSSALTFTTSNWATPQTVTVTGVNDGNNINESVTISHTVSGGDYASVTMTDVAVTMADDDSAGITLSSISGNTTEGTGTATFTIVLNTEPTADVVIALSSSDTTEGTVSPSSVTFTSSNWSSTQTVTVTGVNDDIDDGDISYSIVTAAATSTDSDYSGLNASDASVTNTDNDTAGVTQSATSATIGEASTGTYTVVLDTEPTSDVTITLTSDDTTATTVTSSLTFTSSNWSSAQTVTITGVDDVDLDNEVVTISHSISGGGYGSITMTDYTATMTDDDGIVLNGLTYMEVTSPDTSRVWLDRNLGATQVCTSSTDSDCYGHLYQWGRNDDGHESGSSSSGLNSSITPVDSTRSFGSSQPYDWTTADASGSLRETAWGDSGDNDICPSGFSVPTIAELKADTIDASTTDVINATSAYSSFLKLPAPGVRMYASPGNSADWGGYYWSSDSYVSGIFKQAKVLRFADDPWGGFSQAFQTYRAYSFSVRCIKDL